MTETPADEPTAPPSGEPTAPPSEGPVTGAHGSPPPPPATRVERAPLRRSSADKVLAGVGGGLARTLDVDPVAVRIILVVLGLTFPPVLVAYVAGWVLLARDDEPGRQYGAVVVRESGGSGFWVAFALLTVIVIAALDDGFRGFPLVPLVLIGVGVALWTRDGGDRLARHGTPVAAFAVPEAAAWPGTTPGGVATAPPPGTSAATPTAMPVAAPVGGGGGSGPAGPPTAGGSGWRHTPTPPPKERRPRSLLGPLTIALALLAAGVAATLDVGLARVDLEATEIAAIALLVIGLGLVVGAVVGRARWLVLVSFLLIPPVIVGSVVREVSHELDLSGAATLSDGIGERVVTAGPGDDLPEDLRLLAGSVRVDLTGWSPTTGQLAELDATDPDLTIEMTGGEVIIDVPRDVAWRVTAGVAIGEVELYTSDGDVRRSTTPGFGDRLDLVHEGGPTGGPVLDITVDLDFGVVQIYSPADDQELS